MQTVDLCAPKGKWRIVRMGTGKFLSVPRQLIMDCNSEEHARLLANWHNSDINPQLGCTVFNDQGEAVHGPGFFIPFTMSELRTSRAAVQQSLQLVNA
jgi:hypothetical protein